MPRAMSVESTANPYPGLRPFEFPERHLFFGREGQSEELSRRLQSRFLAVVGTSGSGKSSLVRAGLLPALYGGFMAQAGPRWRVSILRPGNDPIRNLAAALHTPVVFGSVQQEAAPQKNLLEEALIESNLRVSSLGLLEYLKKTELPPDENLLIVVDQFEELFRFKKESRRADADDEATGFVKLLLEATRASDSRVYVVITMRSDFLGDCAQFRDLPEAINKGQYLIPRMTRAQLRQAIEAPAKVHGAQLTMRLINHLLNDIGDNQDQLPILQHALMRTWDEWVRANRPDEPLDLAHYEAIGGMAEALSRHADEAFHELGDERRRKIAERLFKCLTETDRDNRETRRRTNIMEVCAITKATREEVILVVDTFRRAGRTFIMPPPEVLLEDNSLLDISHESLIRNWKLLGKWVKEEARYAQQYLRLVNDAELHQAGLIGYWRDPQLSLALKWRETEKPTPAWARRYHAAFPLATSFLDESEAERTKEQKRERQRQEAELERERALREQAQLLAEANQRDAEKAQALAEARQGEAEKAQALAIEQARRAQIEIENAKRLSKSRRRLRFALAGLLALLALVIGTGFMFFFSVQQTYKAQAELFTVNKALKEEKESLLLTQGALKDTLFSLEGKNDELVAKEKELNDSLKVAEEERRRAQTSESEKAAALEKQKQLTVEANAAKDRAEKTLQREEKNRSGLVFFEKGELNKAKEQFVSLLDDYTKDKDLTLDKSIDGQWWARHNLGGIYGKLYEYDNASTNYNEAIKILGDAPGERRRNLIATLRKLGQLYAESGNHRYGSDIPGVRELEITGYQVAESTYRSLLYTLDAEDSIKKDDPRYEAGVKREFADILYIVKRNRPAQELDEARKLYQEALQAYERNKPEQNTSEIISILNKLTEIAMQQNPAEAKALILQTLEVREKKAGLDPVHPDVAESYSALARYYQEIANKELAADNDSPAGQSHREVAANYENLAGQIRVWAFRINKEKSFPLKDLKDLVGAYTKVGECEKAGQIYADTLRIMQINYADHLFTNRREWLNTLINSARFFRETLKNDEEAEGYYGTYVELSQDEAFNCAFYLDYLEEAASFYHQREKYDEAERILKRVYEMRKQGAKRCNDPDSRNELLKKANTLNKLGLTLEAANKPEEAVEKYREATDLALQLKKDSLYDPWVTPANNLAKLYLKLGKDREAEEYFVKIVHATEPSVKFEINLGTYARMFRHVESLLELGQIEGRKNPNATDAPIAIAYFTRALSALEKADFKSEDQILYLGFDTVTKYYNLRADVLEALAKYSQAERAVDLKKQALAARQKAQALKERDAVESTQKACQRPDVE
jgi:tetratricopeptide (TPR) repeat protein